MYLIYLTYTYRVNRLIKFFMGINMRVLHTALLKQASPGIANQMYWEQLAAEELGIEWRSFLCVSEVSEKVNKENMKIIKLFNQEENWFSLRKKYYDWLMSEQDNFDVLVLRHSSSTPQEYFFLKSINKPVYLVHHTLELPEIISNAGSGIIRTGTKYAIESFFGSLSIKYAKNIICVTNEIFEYENNRVSNKFKQKTIYPNGILFDKKLTDTKFKKEGEIPQILFVAGHFSSWHGLDILLENIKSTHKDFTLHIAGVVDEKDKLTAKQDSRVILHGAMNKDELKILMDKAWIGLSSFALSRKKMTEACTLKVREYLFNGIPVYSGHKDIFPIEFSYYKFGSPKIEDILSFAEEMKSEVREEVSKSAEPYISKVKLLEKLYSDLKILNFH